MKPEVFARAKGLTTVQRNNAWAFMLGFISKHAMACTSKECQLCRAVTTATIAITWREE